MSELTFGAAAETVAETRKELYVTEKDANQVAEDNLWRSAEFLDFVDKLKSNNTKPEDVDNLVESFNESAIIATLGEQIKEKGIKTAGGGSSEVHAPLYLEKDDGRSVVKLRLCVNGLIGKVWLKNGMEGNGAFKAM